MAKGFEMLCARPRRRTVVDPDKRNVWNYWLIKTTTVGNARSATIWSVLSLFGME
jgi:hypothetical protein